ncbi:MAG: hypothetical protein ABWY82_15915 [Tardiphaga sp.]
MAEQIDVGPPPVPLQGGRSPKGVVIVVAVVIAAAAGFAWLAYGDRLSELSALTSSAGPAPVTASDTSSVATAEFLAFQQQTSAALQSATQMLTAQQAEMKRLSDDVANLTAKIDQLQGSVASVRTAPPPVVPARPTAAAPAPAAVPPAAAPAAPRKRPTAPRPAGAISVGGAPLPATGQTGRSSGNAGLLYRSAIIRNLNWRVIATTGLDAGATHRRRSGAANRHGSASSGCGLRCARPG